jgi:hypothetical protein
MKIDNMTLEQKIVYFLAKKGYITNVGDVITALKDFSYAERMVSAAGDPGLTDDIKTGIQDGTIEGVGECAHDTLTNEEIQEVFDNDIQ